MRQAEQARELATLQTQEQAILRQMKAMGVRSPQNAPSQVSFTAMDRLKNARKNRFLA